MITDYFKENFQKIRGTGKYLQLECPFCNHVPRTFTVYPETFSVFCFYADCHYSGSIIQFIMDYEGLSYKEAFLRLKEYQRSFHIPTQQQVKTTNNVLEDKYIPLSEIVEPYPVSARNSLLYLAKRGVTREQIEKYRIGYYFNQIKGITLVFPVYDLQSKLKARIERTLSGEYRIYPKEVDKRKLLYGIHLAKDFQTMIICEGAFDTFAIGDNAVGLIGKTLTDDQFSLLLNLRPKKKFIVVLDGDAKKEAFTIAYKLSKYRETKVTFLEGRKDPSDLRESINEVILNNSKSVKECYLDG